MPVTVLPAVPNRSDRMLQAVMQAIGAFQQMKQMGMDQEYNTARIGELGARTNLLNVQEHSLLTKMADQDQAQRQLDTMFNTNPNFSLGDMNRAGFLAAQADLNYRPDYRLSPEYLNLEQQQTTQRAAEFQGLQDYRQGELNLGQQRLTEETRQNKAREAIQREGLDLRQDATQLKTPADQQLYKALQMKASSLDKEIDRQTVEDGKWINDPMRRYDNAPSPYTGGLTELKSRREALDGALAELLQGNRKAAISFLSGKSGGASLNVPPLNTLVFGK